MAIGVDVHNPERPTFQPQTRRRRHPILHLVVSAADGADDERLQMAPVAHAISTVRWRTPLFAYEHALASVH